MAQASSFVDGAISPLMRYSHAIADGLLRLGVFPALLEGTKLPQNLPPPILTLPDELLITIAGAGQEEGIHTKDLVPFRSEWALAHVSRRFRDVILGTPALWTLAEATLAHKGSVEIFNLYLERSQTCKLWVVLCDSPPGLRAEADVLAQRLRNVVPHIHWHRVRRLGLMIDSVYDLGTMAAILAPFRGTAAPSLQRLEMGNFREYPPGMISGSFSLAPSIKFMELSGFTLPVQLPRWMSSLTLELRHCDFENTKPFLAAIGTQCTSLAHLYLDMNAVVSTRWRDTSSSHPLNPFGCRCIMAASTLWRISWVHSTLPL
ncbi:hypothetical protein C8R43DRAFT_951208 [Mycena crocata]|nr:hypothetical protein C8R43DRAFT_951208 [Mycena crocata]